MSTPDETTVWIGLDIGKTEHFADVLDEAGSPLFAVAVANGEAALRRSSLARSPSAPRRWSSTSPARWPGSCSASPPVAACRWRTCRGWSCAVPPTSTRVSPRPTAATRSCWPIPAAPGATRCTGSTPARRTPGAAARSQRLRHRPRRRCHAAHEPAARRPHRSPPALERVLGPKLHNAGARDLLARYPTPQALATAGRGRIARTLRKRSPRLAGAHRGRHRGPRRPDRGRTRLGRDGSGDR